MELSSYSRYTIPELFELYISSLLGFAGDTRGRRGLQRKSSRVRILSSIYTIEGDASSPSAHLLSVHSLSTDAWVYRVLMYLDISH